jgi:hypothetical protein
MKKRGINTRVVKVDCVLAGIRVSVLGDVGRTVLMGVVRIVTSGRIWLRHLTL